MAMSELSLTLPIKINKSKLKNDNIIRLLFIKFTRILYVILYITVFQKKSNLVNMFLSLSSKNT